MHVKRHLCHCVTITRCARRNGIGSHFAMLAFHLRYNPEQGDLTWRSMVPHVNALIRTIRKQRTDSLMSSMLVTIVL